MPADAFETAVGHFWGIFGTRDYMRARYNLADTLSRSGTLDGVIEALDHLRDMLRLCRGDNMGLRHLVPPLMLQLDQDQECYDFIKWWVTAGRDEHYDWGDIDLPFLNVQGANVFEDVKYMNEKRGDFRLVCGVLLLKMKLLVDIINIKLVRKVCANDGRLPPELWRHVERHVTRSPLSRQWVGKPDQEVMDVLRKLESNVVHLARSLHTMNGLFASGLLDPNEYLAFRPGYYSPGSFEEMQLLLAFSYATWWQHEGVLELLQSAKFITAKESLLEDLGGDSLWVYFDQAVDDAMSLDRIRPSEIRRRLETKK
ncbi:hypothetical protein DV736_g3576, partial [Chaetothyriales sp. CBS 134916]